MSAGHRETPDYLRDPAWLFTKARSVHARVLDRHAAIESAPRVNLPREGRDRSPAWDLRADVLGVYRVGDEWREVVDVTSDHAGTVSMRTDADGCSTVIVTDGDGRAHPYPLERDAQAIHDSAWRLAGRDPDDLSAPPLPPRG